MKHVFVLLSAVALLVAACGNSTSGNAVGQTSAGSTQPVERAVGKKAWYDGFEITVDKVTAKSLQDSQVQIDIALTYRNLINAAHRPGFDGTDNDTGRVGHLEWKDDSSDLEFTSPKIPGLAIGQGTAKREITVQEQFANLDQLLDTMVLVYGDTATNQTRIPFGPNGTVVTEEPRGISVGQTIGSGPTLQLASAYLWPSYAPGEKGKHELWIEFTFSCAESCGDIFYQGSAWTLTDPNGQQVHMDDRSPAVYEQPGPGGKTGSSYAVFVLDNVPSGTYTLNVKGTQDTIEFDETTQLQL
ncbi:hypothetical protein [Smaragdicoccus niigatensis]|uniref:hypothetical protein n=1 Tax=Smaragdicoccus niigatensis TaxID=359359 RepID=UPI0012DD794A|nr:hypothetical protein [Smaragdicoccus niigatensis]